MRSKTWAAVVAAAGVLAVTGCAGREPPTPPEVVPVAASPTMSPTPSPSPTERTATVKQYASVVNPPLTKLAEGWDTYEQKCYPGEESPLCDVYAMTLDLQAQVVVLALAGAMKPDAPVYVGAPPAEIAALVTDTMAAAQALDNTIDEDGAVTGQVFPAGMEARGFVDRWEPYV